MILIFKSILSGPLLFLLTLWLYLISRISSINFSSLLCHGGHILLLLLRLLLGGSLRRVFMDVWWGLRCSFTYFVLNSRDLALIVYNDIFADRTILSYSGIDVRCHLRRSRIIFDQRRSFHYFWFNAVGRLICL